MSRKSPTPPRAGVSFLIGTSGLYIAIALLIGSAVGIGTYTFGYANGASYLGNNPESCANCHSMQGHFDAWVKSSHGKFATCNDCHAPHGNLLGKYYCKARNGFFHSLAFTTGDYQDNLRITDYNRKVTEQACRYCHADTVHQIDIQAVGEVFASESERLESNSCIRCHDSVGHDN